MQKNRDNRIGKAIKVGLYKTRMSQKELSEIMGVKKSTVSCWVSGVIIPPGDKLLKIIEILGILSEFFPGCENQGDMLLRENQVYYNCPELKHEVKELREKVSVLENKMDRIEKRILDE